MHLLKPTTPSPYFQHNNNKGEAEERNQKKKWRGIQNSPPLPLILNNGWPCLQTGGTPEINLNSEENLM